MYTNFYSEIPHLSFQPLIVHLIQIKQFIFLIKHLIFRKQTNKKLPMGKKIIKIPLIHLN